MASNPQKSHANHEEDVLAFWKEHDVFQKSITTRPEGKSYVFYDGPPFATGTPHYGHIVGSVMKDVVPRYFTMKGYRVNRTWGWDCHGLPIENIVEKKFDLGSKKAIEAFGIEQFNNACHSEVLTYAAEWETTINRIGRWVDMKNAYKTMDTPFMESLWWVFKTLYEKGLIYEGRKAMHICPRCETALSNFEVNLNYADVKDFSVYATFTLLSGTYAGAKMIAWTTTPWTLPGNVLLAVNPDFTYVVVEYEGVQLIVLKDRVEEVFKGKTYNVIEEITGNALLGATYEPLFPYFAHHKNAFRVVAGDFVTLETGSGIVHIAPGFGEDDKELAEKENVAPIMHIGVNGHLVREVEELLQSEGYNVEGKPVKAKDDSMSFDLEIIKWLAHKGKLFAKEKITHSYPLCWRCDTPLLNYSASSWFVRVTELKDRLLATNQEINWMPNHMKDGRFGKWLEGARDWAVSRSRFWGTPIPIWKSEDGELICIGSIEELQKLTGVEKIDNLHKHIVDGMPIVRNGKTFMRVPEVLDCWFESGAMPYAQLHYPFENTNVFEHGFPAEFIAEGQDQTRGWFYTLHVLANALFDMPAFKHVVVNGIVLAEDGKKMSKRLKNYPDPNEILAKYGADAVRYYLMASPVVRAENLNFAEKDVHEVAKKFITIARNVMAFYTLYKTADDARMPSGEHPLDAWILARLNQTLEEETIALDRYDLSGAARVLQPFVTDLSTWYVRRSRNRFKVDGNDKQEAIATLRVVLETFAKMIAPFMPFLAEMMYQEVQGDFLGSEKRLSVHLEMWPESVETNTQILDEMGEARAIVSRILDAREEAGRAVKQALASVQIFTPSGEIHHGILAQILEETNIKSGTVEKGDALKVVIDAILTSELMHEGIIREITRRVNTLRKKAGLTIEDRIDLVIWSQENDMAVLVEASKQGLMQAVLARDIRFDKDETLAQSDSFRVYEKDFWIGF